MPDDKVTVSRLISVAISQWAAASTEDRRALVSMGETILHNVGRQMDAGLPLADLFTPTKAGR